MRVAPKINLSDEQRVVAMDPTAFLTLGALELLEEACKLFDCILIPHSTLAWLFEEKQKVSFHQPSRIRQASRLRDLLSNGALLALSTSVNVNADLAAEVGEDLASLIAEAFSADAGDEKQRIVIRPFPVHRIGSLMDEEPDLSPFYAGLSSCSSIVDKLRQKGQLTATEESRARSYLSLHEKEWPSPPEFSDGAVLYLDDLSVTYLQHTGLLGKLRPAGLQAYISERTIKEVDALLRYEQLASKVSEVIESVRVFLADGMQSGTIRLGQRASAEDVEEPKLRYHPTFALLELAKDVQAIIVDDRSLNKHGNCESESRRVPILTTLDLLDSLYSNGHINLDKQLECRTNLRRAGYLFVPLTKDELVWFLQPHRQSQRHVSTRLITRAEMQ